MQKCISRPIQYFIRASFLFPAFLIWACCKYTILGICSYNQSILLTQQFVVELICKMYIHVVLILQLTKL